MKTRQLFSFSFLLLALGIGLAFWGCTDEEKDNLSPSIIITSPNDGDAFDNNSIVTIATNPVDTDGIIMQVMFYVNGEWMSSVSEPPYNYVWHTSDFAMGTYKIKAKVTDDYGGVGNASITLHVITAPATDFEANKTLVFEGKEIQFTDLSDNLPDAWEWDFGDGTTSTEQNPAHIYTTPGKYTVSLKASNVVGTTTETKTDYIEVLSSTFIDERDNEEYKIVEIGTQIWMAENLKYDVGPGNSWYYNNNPLLGDVYGFLYDFQIAQTVCPTGWHLPSDAEWDTLFNYLGGDSVAGYKLKEAGQTHWASPNNASNSTGFTALPGGYRDAANVTFNDLTYKAYFWSTEPGDFGSAYGRKMLWDVDYVERINVDQNNGMSVRCVKDE